MTVCGFTGLRVGMLAWLGVFVDCDRVRKWGG